MKSLLKPIGWISLLFIMFAFTMDKPVKIIFFGDSITQMGVDPGGYIDRMNQALVAKGKSDAFELKGAGIGGNKVYDLYLRLEEDVLSKSPDKVVIWVGVNDVWHKSSMGTGTDIDKFEKFYEAIIKKLEEKKIEIILCTPASIGERNDFSNTQDGDLNQYSKIIRSLAEKHQCQLCDFRTIFHEYSLKHNPENLNKGILTTDGVHLNEKGNQLVCDSLMEMILK
ncbi:MAG: G-D-S-L family lipolytic protein [Bacteroidales bacterium]|nr:G-D-S-L family lipolytic protein [Bacteroidales bacterium]